MRFDRLTRPNPDRLQRGWLYLTAGAYMLLGEILYLDHSPRIEGGYCIERGSDHLPFLLAWAAVVYLVSTSWIATRVTAPWLPKVALHTVAATSVGYAAAWIYFGIRDTIGPECPGLQYCADCSGLSIWELTAPVIIPTLLAVLLSPLIAFPARALSARIRRRRTARDNASAST
jgi:hypothetical protein